MTQPVDDRFEQLLDAGFDHYYDGRWDAAEEAYERARALRPNSGRPLVLQATSRMMQGRMDEARQKLLAALDVDPDCPAAYEGFSALCGIFGGDYHTSVHCLLYALQLKPDRHRTWELLVRQFGLLQAGSLLEEAADLAMRHAVDDSESAFCLRCAVYFATEQRERCIEEARLFRERYPDSRSARDWGWMSQGGPGEADHLGEPEPGPLEESLIAACDEGPDEELDEFLESYVASLDVGDEGRLQIEVLWNTFLDRKLEPPLI